MNIDSQAVIRRLGMKLAEAEIQNAQMAEVIDQLQRELATQPAPEAAPEAPQGS